MTKEEAAAKLDGSEYRREGSRELWAAMKAARLVAAYGASDDLLMFSGAMDDEVGAYDGTKQPMLPTGLPQNECEDGCPYFEKSLKGAAIVEAEWHDQGEGPCWVIKSAIPHAVFSIVEDGEPYCRGIVFSLADVPEPGIEAAARACYDVTSAAVAQGMPDGWPPVGWDELQDIERDLHRNYARAARAA